MTTDSNIFARAHETLENEDLDGVRAALDEAVEAGVDEDDPRLGYLRFMIAWLDENSSDDEIEQQLAEAAELLEGALELADASDVARIVIDVADVLVQAGEPDDAEHALRSLSERDDVSPDALGAACLLRAQILLDHHEDADEALAILESAPALLHEDPVYLSLRTDTLLDLGRGDEAIELLRAALDRHTKRAGNKPEGAEVELHYQLGTALRKLEREDEALEHLLEVRRRDLANFEVDVRKPVSAEEVEDLRRRVEEVLESLPDPLISKIASAEIRVERWASESAVRAGADPRTPLAFDGTPGDGTPDDDDNETRVDAIVVYRDTIIAQIEDDDQIFDVIADGLVAEFARFFEFELFSGM